jgi:DNA-binding beta-propeller fold protein YncE
LFAAAVLAGSGLRLVAAEPASTTAYPRINMVPAYEVDSTWPKPRPAGVEWGAIPGVTVDKQDQIWIFTRAKPPVQVYRPDGTLVRTWGEDIVNCAHQIKFDPEGNVWLVDVKKHVVMKCTPEGKLLQTLGTPNEPGCDESHFNKPTDVAFTPDGQLFVSDGYGNARVVHFDRNGKFVKAWGKLGTAPGEFSLPHSIVIDTKGRLYVADRNNARVQVFDQQGKFLAEWRNVMVPWSLWITANDEIWACGSSPMIWRPKDTVLGCPPKDQFFVKFDTSGRVLQTWTVPKCEDGQEKPGELNWLHSMAFDSKGNIYAVDIMGKRVQKFIPR